MLPAEMNGGNHVGHVSAPGDQTRFAANHSVIDLARFLVPRVGGLDQLTPELTFELSDDFLLHDLVQNQETSGSISTLPWEAF